MQNLGLVAVGHSLERLVHEVLDDFHRDVLVLERADEVLEILVAVLEDQDQSLLVVDDVVQLDNVDMVQLLEQRDLSDGCAGDAFFLRVEVDLLESEELLGLFVYSYPSILTHL